MATKSSLLSILETNLLIILYPLIDMLHQLTTSYFWYVSNDKYYHIWAVCILYHILYCHHNMHFPAHFCQINYLPPSLICNKTYIQSVHNTKSIPPRLHIVSYRILLDRTPQRDSRIRRYVSALLSITYIAIHSLINFRAGRATICTRWEEQLSMPPLNVHLSYPPPIYTIPRNLSS